MKKIFVLDTNVLLVDHQSLFKFEENEVHIPIVVLEELDKFKKEMTTRGYNARKVAKYLDKLRAKRGKLKDGVKLNNGGTLFVNVTKPRTDKKFPLNLNSNDNIIIKHAFDLNAKNTDTKVILVSKDINMRVKAESVNLLSEDHDPQELRDIDKGYLGTLDMEYNDKLGAHITLEEEESAFSANEYINLKGKEGSRLYRYDKDKERLSAIREFSKKHRIMSLTARNKEQHYALDALMDPNIQLVTLLGKAGTGKTLLAIAAGLEQVIHEETYSKIIVSRPVMPLGKDIGYLPGNIEEKMAPYIQPIYDNIDHLFEEDRTKNKRTNKSNLYSRKALTEGDILEVEPLTYIRGRSIPNQFMIVDEAQNLSPHEIKTIITRVGEGTKIVFTGDIDQIDAPYLDAQSNGLTYIINKFKDEPIAAHITLTRGERSDLAELASEIL